MISRPHALVVLVLVGFASTPFALSQDVKSSDKDKERIDKVLQSAQEEMNSGKFDEGIAKIEAALKDNPKETKLLFPLMMVLQQRAEVLEDQKKPSVAVHGKSVEIARKIRVILGKEINPSQAQYLGVVLYAGAGSLASDGKPELAVAMLREAIETGYGDFETFEKDEQWAALRKREDFAKVVKLVDAKKAEIAKKEAETDAKLAEEAKVTVPKMLKEFQSFPFTFKLIDLDDKKIALDDFKGKVTIVDFWGTWCPPCRRELPTFVALHKKYNAKGLEIVGLNYMEDGEPAEVKKTIKDVLAENKATYRCALGDEKTQEQVPEFGGFPTTLFLDRTGKVRLKLEGEIEKPILEEIIRELLHEKS